MEFGETERKPVIDYYPRDPYRDSYLQGIALEQMGYPLRLQPVDATTLGESGDPYENFTMRKYPTWIASKIDSDFAEYIEPLSDTDFLFERIDANLATPLASHPVKIVSDVDFGNLGLLFLEYDEATDGQPTDWQSSYPDLQWRDVVAKCIVAATERRQEWLTDGMPESDDIRLDLEKHYARYLELKRAGVTPINPEQLLGLVIDFYRIVENNFPVFRSFKRKSPPV